ncbi:MAG: hypothetical protein ACRC6T_16300 [Sarcina sp.]
MSKKLLSICMSAAFVSILATNMYLPQKFQHTTVSQNNSNITHHINDSATKLSLENTNELKVGLEENLNENEITYLANHIHKLL